MLKHDSNCLETANEEDGTPALLLNCDESNTNQVKTRIPLVGVKILYYLENVPNVLAFENIRFSSLFVAEDVSRGGTSATQRQKFHTDDVKSVQNPVRSADWSTEQLHCFSYCLRMTDKRQKQGQIQDFY